MTIWTFSIAIDNFLSPVEILPYMRFYDLFITSPSLLLERYFHIWDSTAAHRHFKLYPKWNGYQHGVIHQHILTLIHRHVASFWLALCHLHQTYLDHLFLPSFLIMHVTSSLSSMREEVTWYLVFVNEACILEFKLFFTLFLYGFKYLNSKIVTNFSF